jgi:hypothetical protein
VFVLLILKTRSSILLMRRRIERTLVIKTNVVVEIMDIIQTTDTTSEVEEMERDRGGNGTCGIMISRMDKWSKSGTQNSRGLRNNAST